MNDFQMIFPKIDHLLFWIWGYLPLECYIDFFGIFLPSIIVVNFGLMLFLISIFTDNYSLKTKNLLNIQNESFSRKTTYIQMNDFSQIGVFFNYNTLKC